MASKQEVEGAETLTDDTLGATPTPTPRPLPGGPPEKWDRYELGELLGKGGMGAVYKARDRRLGRTVAIKLILGADPNLAMRFLQEARAQARIDHPNVCRVYEVGEVEGRAYIAIQFVDGEPLNKAAAHMSLDEKVAVMRDVAAAIHEAHKLGIIHRDLKPANIMVERTEDGRWTPVVMDFGLAREVTAAGGLTVSGALLGTPAYMSPEQARGDVHVLDRRSDVYSLGATLYELMTGRPPFQQESLTLALLQVINDDPPAPRSLERNLPVDLETIALKCLAKEPGRRYASARALCDDLDRYLDGEPILGRRPSLFERLRMRARRHRALVILGAWSLLAILVVAGLGVRQWVVSLRERARSGERTRLAERLGQDAKEMEWLLRGAYSLPLHDTRPEREVIRARMRAIAGTRHDLGALGDAVVHNALGRGHLALHEWQKAADELARAAGAGLRTPGLHAARGRALGELYHRSLEEARRSGDKAWLAARQKQLERQYLAPAVAELELSRADRDAGDGAALLEALVALYRRDFAAAEEHALAAVARAPWLFEARKLAADAAYAAAVTDFDRGNYDAARPRLERATTLYREAAEVARSDGSVYEAAAQTWLTRAELDFRQGHTPKEPLDHALADIDHALSVAPDDAGAYTTQAHILLSWLRAHLAVAAADQRLLLERIADAAGKAVALDARDAVAWDALGNAHVYRGTVEMYHGGQGAPWWNRALDEFAKAQALQPNDPWVNNDAGVAHRWLGTSLDEAGRDPVPEYRAALASYAQATTIDPQYVYGWSNQADIQAATAEYDAARGVDPHDAVDGARRAGERCLAVDPSFYLVLNTMAQAELSEVSYLVRSGGDPTAALALARAHLDRAAKIRPENNMTMWFHRVVAAGYEARYRLSAGGDVAASLALGRAALHEALRLAPASADCWVEAAQLDLTEAAMAVRAGRSTDGILAKARNDAEKSVALDDQFVEAHLVAAQAYLALAKAHRSRATLDKGMASIEKALQLNPRLERAKSVREELARLKD